MLPLASQGDPYGQNSPDRKPARYDHEGDAGIHRRQSAVSLHDWLGAHVANTRDSHWESGHFVTVCTICGKAMEKLPGLAWKLRKGRAA